MPTDLLAKGWGIVEYQSTSTGMLTLQWMEKRPMTMLSTDLTSKKEALPPKHQGLQQTKPRIVLEYNNSHEGSWLQQPTCTVIHVLKKKHQMVPNNILPSFGHGCGQLPTHITSPWKENGTSRLQFELLQGLLQEITLRKEDPFYLYSCCCYPGPHTIGLTLHVVKVFCRRRKGERKETQIMYRICKVSLTPSLSLKEYQNPLDAPSECKLMYTFAFINLCIYL